MTKKSPAKSIFADLGYDAHTPKPEYVCLGMFRHTDGWCLVQHTMRGSQVVSSDILAGPDMLAVVREAYKLNTVKKVFGE